MNFLENEFFLLAVTFGIFFLAKLLQKKTGIMLLNPILLTIAILIVFLKMTHISYETYNQTAYRKDAVLTGTVFEDCDKYKQPKAPKIGRAHV